MNTGTGVTGSLTGPPRPQEHTHWADPTAGGVANMKTANCGGPDHPSASPPVSDEGQLPERR